MSRAPASTKAYAHVELSFTMDGFPFPVKIPVAVYNGQVSDHGIKKNTYTLDGHPAGYSWVDKTTGEIIDRSNTVKKIATPNGPVFVEDHEIEDLLGVHPQDLTVKCFQPISLFTDGAYIPKSRYFVEADKKAQGKKKVDNPEAQSSLALLLAAMGSANALALCEFTTRGVPKPAVLLPDGTLWVVYHDDELRERRPLPEIDFPDTALAEAHKKIIDPKWSGEVADLTDTRTAAIQEYADAKAEAGDFGQSVEAAPQPKTEEASGLMAMLMAAKEAQPA